MFMSSQINARNFSTAMRDLDKASCGKIVLLDTHHALMKSRKGTYSLVNDDGDVFSIRGEWKQCLTSLEDKYKSWCEKSR